jgi:hypothetical protein
MKTPHRWFTRDPNSILPTAQVRVVDESDYDALLAERDALQQQVESLQNKWAQRPLSVADTAALEAENDALRAALTKYGRHTTECQQGNLPANLKRAYPCDCGYALVEGDKS